jgi:phenylpropionate dioxygenase-like ring-hydroxylating dioxygenase large terminal subunit
MFVPLDAPAQTLRPAHSGIAPGDWSILADFWYAIARAEDIGEAPVASRLLDVELVLFREEGGTIAVTLDRCPHRHVRLSGGAVVKGQIECPFHGLRFDGTGQCRHVPALGRQTQRLPASYGVQTFPMREKYGLVWTCLGDPARHDIPSLPTFEDVDPAEITFGPISDWPVSAPRQIENFVDLAHLPFVHARTLGGDPARALKPGRIEQQDDGIIQHAEYIETGHDGADRLGVYRYRVVLPFTIDFQVTYPEHPGDRLISSDIATPVSAHVSRVFQLHRVAGGRAAGQGLVDMLEVVNGEDRAVLAQLTLPDLPLVMNREIHLPVDKVSDAYRARLRDLGLGRG